MLRVAVVILVLFAGCVAAQTSAAVFQFGAPYQVNGEFNGITSPHWIVKGKVTSDQPEATLTFGNLEIVVDVPTPPGFNFVHDTAGRCPAASAMGVGTGCLFDNLAAFQVLNSTDSFVDSQPSPFSRRLLDFSVGDAACSLFGAPCVAYEHIEGQISDATNMAADAQNQAVTLTQVAQLMRNATTLALRQTAIWLNDTANRQTLDESQIALLQDDMNTNLDSILQLNVSLADTLQLVTDLSDKVAQRFGNFTVTLNGVLANISSQFGAEDNTTKALALLTNAMIQSVINTQSSDMVEMTQNIQLNGLADELRSSSAYQSEEMFQLLALTILASVKASNKISAAVGDGFQLMTDGDIVLPRSLLDPPASALTNRQQYVAQRFNFVDKVAVVTKLHSYITFEYYDTDYALDKISPFTTVNLFLYAVGPSDCKRNVATDSNGNVVDESSPFSTSPRTCRAWIEVYHTHCIAADPTFKWSTYAQTAGSGLAGAIIDSHCSGSIQTDDPLVFRSMVHDYKTFHQTTISNASFPTADGTAKNEIQITILDQGSPFIRYVNQNTAYSSLRWDQIAGLSYKENDSLADLYWTMFSTSSLNAGQLAIARVGRDGALADGFKPSLEPFTFQTVPRDNDGNPTPLPGSKVGPCTSATFSYAALATEPINLVSSLSGNWLTKRIRVKSVRYLDASRSIYNFTTTDVTTGLLFTSDLGQPRKEAKYIGSFTEGYIFDVPQDLIQIDSNPRMRKKTPTYFLMQPDETQTLTMREFKDRYKEYDPTFGAYSLAPYKIALGRDSKGFPYCLLPQYIPPGEVPSSSEAATIVDQTTPQGTWGSLCKEMQDFQITDPFISAGQGRQTKYAREWELQFELLVPSGDAYEELGNTGCPLFSQLARRGENLEVDLTGDPFNTLQLRITTTVPDGTPDCSVQKLEKLLANDTLSIEVPFCPDMTVFVETLTDVDAGTYTVCTFDKSNSTDVQIINHFRDVPSNVERALVEAQNNELQNQADITRLQQLQILNQYKLLNSIFEGNATLNEMIDNATEILQNTDTLPPSFYLGGNFSSDLLAGEGDLFQQIDSAMKNITNNFAHIQANNNASASLWAQIELAKERSANDSARLNDAIAKIESIVINNYNPWRPSGDAGDGLGDFSVPSSWSNPFGSFWPSLFNNSSNSGIFSYVIIVVVILVLICACYCFCQLGMSSLRPKLGSSDRPHEYEPIPTNSVRIKSF